MLVKLSLLFSVLIRPGDCECIWRTFRDAKVEVCSLQRCKVQEVNGCIGPQNVPGNPTWLTIQTKVRRLNRGAFRQLPTVEHITVANCNLRYLVPHCFINLPSLTYFSAGGNNLTEVPFGVFTSTKIKRLSLSHNNIKRIEPLAFAFMDNLVSVNLGKNKLKKINPKWFLGSKNIETLLFNKNNLTVIKERTFDTFPKLNVIDLSFNQIHTIEPMAFKGIRLFKLLNLMHNSISHLGTEYFQENPKFEILFLTMNNLSSLPKDFLNSSAFELLYLIPNPWSCACYNEICTWALEKNVTIVSPFDDIEIFWKESLPTCITPKVEPTVCSPHFNADNKESVSSYFSIVDYDKVVF